MMLRLVQTCGACPEQYDVYCEDKKVGYMRLRHGYFSCENRAGNVVFSGEPEGDGIFRSSERTKWLNKAVRALEEDLARGRESEVEEPNFTIEQREDHLL
jgi:hypothetical protein